MTIRATWVNRYPPALLAGITAIYLMVYALTQASPFGASVATFVAATLATLAVRSLSCRVELLRDRLVAHGLVRSRNWKRHDILGFEERTLFNGSPAVCVLLSNGESSDLPWGIINRNRSNSETQLRNLLEEWRLGRR